MIERARNAGVPAAVRHEAFQEIVRRFQDLAFACACARLRDPALAEDAAQDAFLNAWQRLDELRDPGAFPVWLRRLVRTQCNRRSRSPRLELVAEDQARNVAVTQPAMDLDADYDAALVRLALTRLKSSDRLVVLLFYGAERTQKEIADWLRVPVTTVARRLAHAKRRLRSHMLDLLSRKLQRDRRVAAETFALDVAARLRPAVPGDETTIAILETRASRDDARRRGLGEPACAYIVEAAADEPIAYAAAMQTIFKPIYELRLALTEGAIEQHAADVLLLRIVEDLKARDAISLQHRTSARRAARVEFLAERGFEIIERAHDLRLDAHGIVRLLAASGEPDGRRFTSLEALGESPDLFDDTLRLMTTAFSEKPNARPLLPIHPDAWRRVLRAQRHGIVVVTDGAVQGLLAASMDDVVPDAWRINVVVVRAEQRRNGLATKMLARLVRQNRPAALRVVTSSWPGVAQWLERCGFVPVADALVLERVLRPTVRLAPEQLDQFIGRYVVDGVPVPPIIIERHGDALISKSRDMCDVLLASSEREFFTRHHYGRGRFEFDESGRVARLVYVDGSREFTAVRRLPGA